MNIVGGKGLALADVGVEIEAEHIDGLRPSANLSDQTGQFERCDEEYFLDFEAVGHHPLHEQFG